MSVTQFTSNEYVTRSNVNSRITEINNMFPVSVSNGGTGQTSLTSGDILLGNGTSGITSTSTLSVSKGGTGQTSLTSGDILLGNGTSGITSTNILPIAKGGTGSQAIIEGVVVSNGTLLYGQSTLPLSKGGTGGTTATQARTNLSVLTGTSLWGNSSGTTSTITFTGNYGDYEYIYVQGEDNDVATNNMFRPVTASQVSICNWYATAASNPTGMYYHGCYLSFSYSSSTDKTTVTFERNGTYTVKMAANTADTWATSSTAGIYITKIMGYKY